MKRAKTTKRTFVKAKGKKNLFKTGNGTRHMTMPDQEGNQWPVIDAKDPLVLEVLDDDVKQSELGRLEPASCAAAYAIMRQEGLTEAKVFRTKIYMLKNDKKGKFWERRQTPLDLRIELGAFDRGGEFEPRDFRLNAPYPSQKPGYVPKHPGSRSYTLKAVPKAEELPRKSNHSKYTDRTWKTGSRPLRSKAIKVRPRPSGYSK